MRMPAHVLPMPLCFLPHLYSFVFQCISSVQLEVTELATKGSYIQLFCRLHKRNLLCTCILLACNLSKFMLVYLWWTHTPCIDLLLIPIYVVCHWVWLHHRKPDCVYLECFGWSTPEIKVWYCRYLVSWTQICGNILIYEWSCRNGTSIKVAVWKHHFGVHIYLAEQDELYSLSDMYAQWCGKQLQFFIALRLVGSMQDCLATTDSSVGSTWVQFNYNKGN